MQILRSVRDMRAFSRTSKQHGRTVAFVPTMGALHEGHLSLIGQAKAAADVVAVSIFVNPTQFGPNEDLARYPRPFERDVQLLEVEGVHALFYPEVSEMYPAGATTFVHVTGLEDRLDGASRPGHFRGVATVVSKLFHAVEPDLAFFGQKDAAQHAVIRRMVRDLDLPIEVHIGEIVREPDGLALSSRNVYLSQEDRKRALVLSRALTHVRDLADQGLRDSAELIAAALNVFAAEPSVRVDYVAIVDPDELTAVPDVDRGALVAVAAFVGTTRLIDNLVLPRRA
ncbi:MAG TPA: pantoate--beta-alanine ligase [Terriglobales bacterium]|jgi:pantoate--beta-alanine ligase